MLIRPSRNSQCVLNSGDRCDCFSYWEIQLIEVCNLSRLQFIKTLALDCQDIGLISAVTISDKPLSPNDDAAVKKYD
jgi:hypothetical protein